jgi:hypothetical protein
MNLLSINWYSIFYWLTVSDSVKQFFDTASNIFSWFCVFAFFGTVICSIVRSIAISEYRLTSSEEESVNSDFRSWDSLRLYSRRFFFVFLGLAVITWTGFVFTPTKKDCLLIVAGGSVGSFITSDSSTKALPSDVTKYLHLSLKNEINNLNNKAKEEIGLDTVPIKKSTKATLLEKAESLTKQELIDYLKNDTTINK